MSPVSFRNSAVFQNILLYTSYVKLFNEPLCQIDKHVYFCKAAFIIFGISLIRIMITLDDRYNYDLIIEPQMNVRKPFP